VPGRQARVRVSIGTAVNANGGDHPETLAEAPC
jgi:hypothetical protein